MMSLSVKFMLVALGGAVGAMMRYAVSLLFPAEPHTIPWSTMLVNVLGSLCMGVVFVILVDRGLIAQGHREFWIVGLLGAFTTFSTFSLEVVHLLQSGNLIPALVYIVLSLILCIVAAFLGVTLARSW